MTTLAMLDGLPDTSRFELSWRIRGMSQVDGTLLADGRALLHMDMRRFDQQLGLDFRHASTSALVGRCRWDRRHGAWGRADIATTEGQHVVRVVKQRPGWFDEPWHLAAADDDLLAWFEEPVVRSVLRRYLRLPSRWELIGHGHVLARVVDARSLTRFAATIDIADPDLEPRDVEQLLLGVVVRHARHLH